MMQAKLRPKKAFIIKAGIRLCGRTIFLFFRDDVSEDMSSLFFFLHQQKAAGL